MACEWPYDTVAGLTLTFFGFVVAEMILSLIFTVNDGRIRYRFRSNLYQRTTTFIAALGLLIAFMYLITTGVNDQAMDYLCSFDERLPLLTISSFSLFAFWTSKVMLGRKWKFHTTWVSLIIFGISVAILVALEYYFPRPN